MTSSPAENTGVPGIHQAWPPRRPPGRRTTKVAPGDPLIASTSENVTTVNGRSTPETDSASTALPITVARATIGAPATRSESDIGRYVAADRTSAGRTTPSDETSQRRAGDEV